MTDRGFEPAPPDTAAAAVTSPADTTCESVSIQPTVVGDSVLWAVPVPEVEGGVVCAKTVGSGDTLARRRFGV